MRNYGRIEREATYFVVGKASRPFCQVEITTSRPTRGGSSSRVTVMDGERCEEIDETLTEGSARVMRKDCVRALSSAVEGMVGRMLSGEMRKDSGIGSLLMDVRKGTVLGEV
jgi:hypothetical protein